MSKKVLFGKDGMEIMLKGLNKAAEAVTGTMGPKGRNVYIMDTMLPSITNDGVTVAGKIKFKDQTEDAGAYVIRNVTGQQNDDVGDGTTTTALLTQTLILEALKRPENAMEVKASLKEAGEKVLNILAKKSIKLKKEDIEKVALISSEDATIARLITEIIDKLGEDAVVNVEDSKTFATEYEIVDGYEAHVGYMSPHFVTEKKSAKAIYTDVPVLVAERKINNIQDIKPIFEMFQKEGINTCVFVCDDIDDSILGMLVQNKLMGTFNSLVVKAQAWLLEDIEGAVGATGIKMGNGVSFQNFKKEYLGMAKKVICTTNKTLFTTDGIESKKYASVLELKAEEDPSLHAKKNLKNRAAKLRGGVAALRIGAPTDFERDYLRLKAEDSVKAVQAALAEGIVEGSGMAFWRIAQDMKPKTIGEEILKKALVAPFRKILENAGKDYTEIVFGLTDDKGYNAKEDNYTDLLKSGIIDPSKVERCALENAISAASTFITSNCIIVDEPEDVKTN